MQLIIFRSSVYSGLREVKIRTLCSIVSCVGGLKGCRGHTVVLLL